MPVMSRCSDSANCPRSIRACRTCPSQFGNDLWHCCHSPRMGETRICSRSRCMPSHFKWRSLPAPGSRPTWPFDYRGVVRIPETPLRKLRAHLPTRSGSRSWVGAGVGRTPGAPQGLCDSRGSQPEPGATGASSGGRPQPSGRRRGVSRPCYGVGGCGRPTESTSCEAHDRGARRRGGRTRPRNHSSSFAISQSAALSNTLSHARPGTRWT